MTYDTNKGIERARFDLTVEEYSKKKAQFKYDGEFLRRLLQNSSYRELLFDGLVEVREDTSRSNEIEKSKKEILEMDETTFILKYLSNATDTMLVAVNPYYLDKVYNINDPTQFIKQPVYSLKEIKELVASVVDQQYTTSKGEIKKLGGWTRLFWFQRFVDAGYIDTNTHKILANVTDYVYDSYVDRESNA